MRAPWICRRIKADATLTDENGKTPLELAGNDEVKAVFAEHAAYI